MTEINFATVFQFKTGKIIKCPVCSALHNPNYPCPICREALQVWSPWKCNCGSTNAHRKVGDLCRKCYDKKRDNEQRRKDYHRKKAIEHWNKNK